MNDPIKDNPYASPAATSNITVQDSQSIREELPVASQTKRFLNLIVDNVILQVFSYGAGFALGVVYLTSRNSNGMITAEEESSLRLAGMGVGLIMALAYFVIMEALFQRTVGKFLTGTIVVTANGSRPSFGQIVGRSFARLIPFEAFSFLSGKNPVGWHDSLSGTRVVESR